MLRRDNIRRFALVACTVTGALTWISIPTEAGLPRPTFAIAGLVAALLSAVIPWSPRWVATAPGRIALAACIVFSLIGFAVPAARDLHTAGIDIDFLGGWLILLWLLAAGVLSRLLIRGLKPGHAHAGTILGAMPIVAFVAPSLAAAATTGIAIIFAAVPTLLAAWVTDRLLRLVASNKPAVPAARVVRLDSSPDGGLGEGTVSGD